MILTANNTYMPSKPSWLSRSTTGNLIEPTYFEGEAARHPKARRGHSKGKRTDKTVFVLLSRQVPYQDSTVDYEALAVQRHAPRWIKQLRKFGYLPKMA